MANIIQGGTVFVARTWFARKENKTSPGLIELLESAPIPRLTPEEDRVFQESYAKWLPHAEALLAGDDAENEDGSSTGYSENALRSLAAADDEDDQPSTGTIKDRIRDLLAGGPMALKDVRQQMPDVAPGSVNNAMQELQRISPTGVNDNKQSNVDVPGYTFSPAQTISKQTLETLQATKDASGASVMSLFAFTTNANGSGTITKMNDGKTFAQITSIMKSAVDQASQNNQLEMTTLQGLTNKYNQSIETMSDLVSKFNDLNAKLAGNFHPLR
jgi:hypothetical protein